MDSSSYSSSVKKTPFLKQYDPKIDKRKYTLKQKEQIDLIGVLEGLYSSIEDLQLHVENQEKKQKKLTTDIKEELEKQEGVLGGQSSKIKALISKHKEQEERKKQKKITVQKQIEKLQLKLDQIN